MPAAHRYALAGEVDASVDSISVGGTTEPGRPVSDPVLRSPSNECMHLLRVTDLHAMASRETSFLRGASNHQRFLDMHIGPIGSASAQTASASQQFDAHMWPHAGLTADERRMDMQPSSLQINFVLAGVEVGRHLILGLLHTLPMANIRCLQV